MNKLARILQRAFLGIVTIFLVAASPAGAGVFYVSTAGSDAGDGLTLATAWRTIDHGDIAGVVGAGDTVYVLAGTYLRTNSVTLTRDGLQDAPIVYAQYSKTRPVIDLSKAGKPGVTMGGKFTVFDGFEITNANDDGIRITQDSCEVKHCLIYGVAKTGIKVQSSDNLVYRNVVYETGERGIRNEDSGEFRNLFFHNIVASCSGIGIELQAKVKTARLFNNIVVQNGDKGISGPVEAVCAFNNVWGNLSGNYVGVVDSAGGISKLPKFVDAAAHRFGLQDIAFEINAGFDLGLEYTGSAPDIGAYEKYNVYYVSPAGDDSADGKSALTAWRTIDRGDTLLRAGDTVYVAPGTYAAAVTISDNGFDWGDRVVYQGEPDSTFVDATGTTDGVLISGSYVTWSGIGVSGASGNNFTLTATGTTIQESRILNAGRYGIRTERPVELYGCVVAGSDSAGVYCAGGTGGFVYNNTFYDNGAYGYRSSAIDASLTNNIFAGHTTAAVQTGSTTDLTYSLFFNNTFDVTGGVSAGYGSVSGDPLLVDPDNGDFQLQSNSPAIDAGTDVGRDFAGPAPDIGAYEAAVAVSLTITPVRDTLSADSTYQFAIVAVDAYGDPAAIPDLVWSHTFADGDITAAGLFTPQSVGLGRIIASSASLAIADTTNEMTVIAGALSGLSISPLAVTLSTDSTVQFTAVGQDVRGNVVDSVGTLMWQVWGGIGTIDANGLFDPTTAGKGVIRVSSDLGVAVQSDTIVVTPGALASLRVQPAENIQGHDESFQYHAYGYDADSNLVIELTDSATWSTTDLLGSVTSAGVYTSNLLADGTYYVIAEYGAWRDSAEVIVTDQLSRIRIELANGTALSDTLLSTDVDTTRLYCRAYTILNVLIGDVSVEWSVIGTDSIGVPSPASGTATTLLLTRPGTGQVAVRDSLGRVDTSGVITCAAGEPVQFDCRPETASISADSTQTFTCVSLDADGNPSVPGVVPNWFVLGGIGSITTDGVFTPTAIGTGAIVCFGGGITDTIGPITVVPGTLADIQITPDSTVVTADGGRQFAVTGVDSHGNPVAPGTITWGLTTPLGTIDSSGYFDAVTVGTGKVFAVSSDGPVDTSAFLQVVAGRLTSLTITPDSISTTTDSPIQFTAVGSDADGNVASSGQLDWAVIGDIGDIYSSGLFTPTTIGVGRIAVSSTVEDVSDTNTAVVVAAGALDRLTVLPDTATLNVGDTVTFAVVGYDASFNVTDPGELTWSVSGGIGSIDAAGRFTAEAPGRGRVSVVSETYGVSDSSGIVTVEALNVSNIPLGSFAVFPGTDNAALLAFRVDNFFATPKAVQQITVRSALRGPGDELQRLSNLTGLSLYFDRDGDSILTPADSLIVETGAVAAQTAFSFPPLTIDGSSGRNFIVASAVSLTARDSDSLDLTIQPSVDVQTADGTTVVGPDSVNSLGYAIINGMVAAQISTVPSGTTALVPGDTLYNVLTLDLPRNGYTADTLSTINVTNEGTAPASNISRLALFADDGDGVWDGEANEISLGDFGYTGALWGRSGLSYPLTSPTTRFFVAVRLTEFPTSGATVALGVPVYGVIVRSGNDGPLDRGVVPTDTIPIQTFESIVLNAASIPSHPVAPGEATGPMFGFRLTSNYALPIGLDSVTLTLTATDPRGATQAQLDSQIDSVLLYLNRDDDFDSFGGADSLLAVGTVAGGKVHFDLTGLSVPSDGGNIELSAGLQLSDLARDGNTLALQLADSSDLHFAIPASVDGVFPSANTAAFTIDAFSSDQVTVYPVAGATLFGGQPDYAVLDFELPANGYSIDSLKWIRVENMGSFSGTADILTLKLWAEKNTPGYTADDSLLGTLTYAVGGWVLGNLRYAIGSGGHRFYVTVSVASTSFTAGTVRLRVPVDGIQYRSGADGPGDAAVANPNVQLIVPSNRITAISVPSASTPVRPGSAGNPMMTFALYNGYVGHDQTLKSVALSNVSHSRSGRDYADYELGQVSLYFDADNNRTMGDDSLVALGTFVNGRLQLSGLDILLPAESLSYFFVVADFPPDQIDSDSLAVAVVGAADFGFGEAVSINGDMPLTGGGYAVIDGSVRMQYRFLPRAPRTLSPLDSSVTLLAFKPAINGDQTDTLEAVTIGNAGTATDVDIEQLTLWLDSDTDAVREDSDSLLGIMTYAGGAWSLNGLRVQVTNPPPTLFVVADIAAGATPDASFRGVLPLNGCLYKSANDGPNDSAMTDHNIYTISNSALQVAYTPLSLAYTVGQSIDVRLTVTNISDSVISGVVGAVTGITDSSLVTFAGGDAGPVSLDPGQSTDFDFNYMVAAAGSEAWQLRAYSSTDSSAVIATNTTTIEQLPSAALARLVNSVPTAVTRGQENVFPLSLVFTHPDTASTTAALSLDSLILTVENGAGAGISADAVFSRMVVSTGTATLTAVEDVPSGSNVTIRFDQPLIVPPGGERRLSLLVDIDSAASASQFALAVTAATSLPFTDANAGLLLPLDAPSGFPMRTAPCRIDDPSRELAVSYDVLLGDAVNLGQKNVELAQLNFRHPGSSSSSDIQLSALSVTFVDGSHQPVPARMLFDEIRVVRQQTTIGWVSPPPPESTTVQIVFGLQLTLNPGQRDSVRIVASIRSDVEVGAFAMTIPDSTAFVVRDHSSGSELVAATDTSGLATGATIFPIETGVAHFHQAAVDPTVCATVAVPPTIVGGVDSLGLFDLSLTYPYDTTYSAVRQLSVMVNVLDSLGSPLDPNRLFDRIGYRLDGGAIAYQPFVELFSGGALFRLSDTGVVISPGETRVVTLAADIEADVPFDHFVLQIPSPSALQTRDVTDTTNTLSTAIGCGETFPYSAGITEVLFAAGRPSFSPGARPVQTVYAGQTGVPLMQAALNYVSSTPQGALGLQGITGRLVHNTGKGTTPCDANGIIGDARFLVDGNLVPGTATITGDSVSVWFDEGYRVERNDQLALSLVVDLAENAPVGNYFMRFDDSSFLAIEDINAMASVYTGLSNAVYPIQSTELSLTAASLENSFSNYPNPFNPSIDGHTTIAYVLDEAARVDIEIFSITGEAVREIIMDAPRAAGAHQEDTWEGVNGSGTTVMSGTYFCRITARYASGREDTFRRKVAVVR